MAAPADLKAVAPEVQAAPQGVAAPDVLPVIAAPAPQGVAAPDVLPVIAAPAPQGVAAPNVTTVAIVPAPQDVAAPAIEKAAQRTQAIKDFAQHCLYKACKEGLAEAVAPLIAAYDLTPAEVHADGAKAFKAALTNGYLGLAKALHEKYPVPPQCVKSGHCGLLWGLLAAGRLESAKWLVSTFGFTAEDIEICECPFCVPELASSTLQIAPNHEAVAWILHDLPMSDGARRRFFGAFFRVAQALTQLTRMRELARAYPNLVDVRDSFIAAAGSKNLAVMKWLAEEFKLLGGNFKEPARKAFLLACKEGYLEMAQWLAGRFDLDAAAVQSGNDAAISLANRNGHADIVNWLQAKFYV